MGIGNRESGIGSACSTKLRVNFRPARTPLFPVPCAREEVSLPDSRFPMPGAESVP